MISGLNALDQDHVRQIRHLYCMMFTKWRLNDCITWICFGRKNLRSRKFDMVLLGRLNIMTKCSSSCILHSMKYLAFLIQVFTYQTSLSTTWSSNPEVECRIHKSSLINQQSINQSTNSSYWHLFIFFFFVIGGFVCFNKE